MVKLTVSNISSKVGKRVKMDEIEEMKLVGCGWLRRAARASEQLSLAVFFSHRCSPFERGTAQIVLRR